MGTSTWHTYVLECADGTLYTGVTIDLERRLAEHNAGGKKAAKYMRPAKRRPAKLLWSKRQPCKKDAYYDEYRIKQMPREYKLKMIAQDCANAHPDAAGVCGAFGKPKRTGYKKGENHFTPYDFEQMNQQK